MLTHLPEAWVKSNWIQTSENYEKNCLNKHKFFKNLIWFSGMLVKNIKANTVIFSFVAVFNSDEKYNQPSVR